MRNHRSFIIKPPVDKAASDLVDKKIAEAKEILAEAKRVADGPSHPTIDLSALEVVIVQLAELVSKPKKIAIQVIRSKDGDIVSMIGTTDSAEIAAIESGKQRRIN